FSACDLRVPQRSILLLAIIRLDDKRLRLVAQHRIDLSSFLPNLNLKFCILQIAERFGCLDEAATVKRPTEQPHLNLPSQVLRCPAPMTIVPDEVLAPRL